MTWLRPAAGAALACGLFALMSCGSSGEPESNEGGAPSSGGASSSGGSSSDGGKSSGGASSTGGKSSGGASSTGGKSSGGASSNGGASSGGVTSGGKSSGGASSTGGASTGGVTGGVVCGSRICQGDQVCCNASCSRCAAPDMACDQQACDPPSGGSGGSGGGGACLTAADCRLVDDYCDGCNCRALAEGEKVPVCTGTMVSCLVAPCSNKTADCVGGRCVAVTGI